MKKTSNDVVVEKSENRISIRRGPGSGTSYWGESPIELPDKGASITFHKWEDGSIYIMFSYQTDFKNPGREISISKSQADELYEFLGQEYLK